jgi:UDPglucose 6-dehydrogenase
MAAAKKLARELTGYAVILTKSRVPLGINRKINQAVAKPSPYTELLRESVTNEAFTKRDRVVEYVQTMASELPTDCEEPLVGDDVVASLISNQKAFTSCL